jgi:hypothetical protein
MTTFVDREHALEAHFASLELSAFRERSRRCQRLGLKLAGILDLRGPDARLLALEVGERCVLQPSDEDIYKSIAEVLSERGVPLTATEVHQLASAKTVKTKVDPAIDLPRRSWVEFVTSELLSLFGLNRLTAFPLPSSPARRSRD